MPRAPDNLCPRATVVLPFYRSMTDLASTFNRPLLRVDVRLLLLFRVAEALCRLAPSSSRSVPPNYSYAQLVSAAHLGPAQDVQRQKVGPPFLAKIASRWGVVSGAQCPN